MKYLAISFLSLLIFISSVPNADAQKVRLRSLVTPPCASGTSKLKYADIYADGNIAVQGSYACRGAFIYDISNPDAPVLSAWYNPGNNQQFLEAIVVGNRGYFGSGNGGGVHIVDLSVPTAPQLLGIVNSQNGDGLSSIHEMLVWGNYLIENANSLGNKTIRIINVSDPAAAVFVRDLTPTEPLWVHAMHIRGNRMFTSGWGTDSQRGRTEIYDISNLSSQAPTLLGFIEDPSPNVTAGNNMHSSWTSEDGDYLYSARETNDGSGDLRVYNISNPAVPLLVNSIGMGELGLNAITPHNPVVMGNYLYVSWYQAGVQVFNITDRANPVRVGQYDTYQPAFAPTAAEKMALASAGPWDMMCSSEFRQNQLPTTYDGNWAVYPFRGMDRVLAGDLSSGLLILDATRVAGAARNVVADFDGDGKTDHSQIYDGTTWVIERSSDGVRAYHGWGNGTDKFVNGDFDGDGKADIAVWRPSNGSWYIVQSTLGIRTQQWGVPGDKALTGDYDRDGKSDIVIWRPSNGRWYIIESSTSFIVQIGWGETGDKPLMGDFDGDGRTDLTVFRPGNNTWYMFNPFSSLYRTQVFGEEGDIPVPGDYDGDGKFDVAVFRPSNNVWYRLNSSNGGFLTHLVSSNISNFTSITPAPKAAQPE